MAAIWGDDPSEIAVLEKSPGAAQHDNETKPSVEAFEHASRSQDQADVKSGL